MNPQPPLIILVVDDEAPILDMLQRVGEQRFSEASFIGVDSPQQALIYIDDKTQPQPQLILLDIDFHQTQTGLDLLPALQARLQGQTPIIMFSSLTQQIGVTEAYKRGAVSYIQKPHNLSEWRAFIETLKKYWYQTVTLPE